jgi:cobaltochelatase CobS
MATKEEIQVILEDDNVSPEIKAMASKVLEEEFKGDEVAQKMIKLSQLFSGAGGGVGAVDEDEVREIVRETIEKEKISEVDLDSALVSKINSQPIEVKLNVQEGTVVKTKSTQIGEEIRRPIVQKLLSDIEARNNVYLYGGAGTGKTFMAKTLRDFLDWELITISCNQFTSPLEIQGGQTIDGYQEGKAIRAWGNLNPDGTKMSKQGCILLLDELPKLDPNTAGILNAMLARIAEFQGNGEPETIENGRGDKIKRGNVFVIATGNTVLNSESVDYEANFKQDLSLQDRFVGSTYELFVDVELEWSKILNKKWAFIFIYLNKLRKAIFDNNFQGKAFVSIRIMQSAQKTYQVFRTIDDGFKNSLNVKSEQDLSFTPAIGTDGYERSLSVLEKSGVKTLEDTMDEFFNLFTEEQVELLKKETDYNEFLRIIQEKNKLPLDQLNTASELEQVKDIIKNSPKN